MHQPVLYQEVLEFLKPQAGGRYLDGTVGLGGHAAGILQASAPDGLLLGLDLDPHALKQCAERLRPFQDRFQLVQASYTELAAQIDRMGWSQVEGVLLDLGASSMQFEAAERGFSFRADAPLDMRFDPGSDRPTAADLLNSLPEHDLADLLFRYGEERASRRLARAIVAARPIRRTAELADIVVKSLGRSRRARPGQPGVHPATRTFQALRIAVNQELQAVETVLPVALAALAPAGRLVVISFHSLEDRLVKQFIRRESQNCICPPEQPVCTCEHRAALRALTRKPVKPSQQEIQSNFSARSARLRAAEKIES